MNSELMRQLVALNDKIVNGEELNALQRQLRSELSALLAQETAEKNKPKASDASPIAAEGGNDFVNDPVYIAPSSFREPSILGRSTSARKDNNESLNDPVDCNPDIGVTQSVPSQREQTTAKDLSFNNFNISAPFDAGSARTSTVFQSVGAQEAIIREQERLQQTRVQEAADQELARRVLQEQAQQAWAQREAERQRREYLTTEGEHTVKKCSSCGHSQILVEGMYRDNRDTCEIHTCQRCNDKLHYNHTFFDGCTLNRHGTDGHRFVSGIRVDYSKWYNVPV